MSDKIKFLVTPERVKEALGYVEFINVLNEDTQTALHVAPRFVVSDDGNRYAVTVEHDSEGNITKFVAFDDVFKSMAQVSVLRLTNLASELKAAAQKVSAQGTV